MLSRGVGADGDAQKRSYHTDSTQQTAAVRRREGSKCNNNTSLFLFTGPNRVLHYSGTVIQGCMSHTSFTDLPLA